MTSVALALTLGVALEELVSRVTLLEAYEAASVVLLLALVAVLALLARAHRALRLDLDGAERARALPGRGAPATVRTISVGPATRRPPRHVARPGRA